MCICVCVCVCVCTRACVCVCVHMCVCQKFIYIRTFILWKISPSYCSASCLTKSACPFSAACNRGVLPSCTTKTMVLHFRFSSIPKQSSSNIFPYFPILIHHSFIHKPLSLPIHSNSYPPQHMHNYPSLHNTYHGASLQIQQHCHAIKLKHHLVSHSYSSVLSLVSFPFPLQFPIHAQIYQSSPLSHSLRSHLIFLVLLYLQSIAPMLSLPYFAFHIDKSLHRELHS